MKTGRLIFVLSLPLFVLHAQEEATPISRLPDLPLPTGRKSVVVAADERNPFGIKQFAKTDFGIVQGETEESRLRSLIARLPVRGVTVSQEGKTTVALGPLSLTEGQEIAPLLSSQFERIVVNQITDQEVILGFLERDGSSKTRAFSIQYNVTPKVRFALPSDIIDSAGGTRPFPLSGVAGPEANEGL